MENNCLLSFLSTEPISCIRSLSRESKIYYRRKSKYDRRRPTNKWNPIRKTLGSWDFQDKVPCFGDNPCTFREGSELTTWPLRGLRVECREVWVVRHLQFEPVDRNGHSNESPYLAIYSWEVYRKIPIPVAYPLGLLLQNVLNCETIIQNKVIESTLTSFVWNWCTIIRTTDILV